MFSKRISAKACKNIAVESSQLRRHAQPAPAHSICVENRLAKKQFLRKFFLEIDLHFIEGFTVELY